MTKKNYFIIMYLCYSFIYLFTYYFFAKITRSRQRNENLAVL